MKNFTISLLGLFLFYSNGPLYGQNKLNEVFDKTILLDKEFNVQKTTKFPPSDKSAIIKIDSIIPLKYSSDQKLWDNYLRKILDNPRYSKNEKIQFIKDALADTTRDAFEYINNRGINFWRTSKEATQLIEKYFSDKKFECSDNPRVIFKYLEFKTKSLYPETYNLTIDYFRERPSLNHKYRDEGDLIYRLIELNKEEDAVKYLEILIDDYINDRTKYINLGGRMDQFYKGYVFDILCFSDNKYVADKATDLLFKLLNSKNYNTYELYMLTEYVDKERHHLLLKKWYEYYSKIDFTGINIEEVSSDKWKAIRQSIPQAIAYVDFMRIYSGYLGERFGKEFWEEFLSKVKYTQHHNNSPFQDWQLKTLESVFKNKSLTHKEKQNMLFQSVKTTNLFQEYRYKDRYLKLVSLAFPDLKMKESEFEQLKLGEVLKYSYPLDIRVNELRIFDYSALKLTEEKIDRLISDLNNFSKENNLDTITLSKKERFSLSLTTAENFIIFFLQKKNLLLWFDPEGSSIPINYVNFFEWDFRRVLSKWNVKFEISQVTKEISGQSYAYEIYLKYKNSIYTHKYTEQGTTWYNPQRIAKSVNLALIDNKDKRRLIEINTDDKAAMFVFIEPQKIKPLLNKYQMDSWAIKREDEFHILTK